MISSFQKSILLKPLNRFVSVCKGYGLRYYLAAGSVLGAIRHKGMIPWDDDIDVYMPRDDYEKLQLIPREVWGDEFRLASWRTTRHYRYDFLKVEVLNTTVIERFHPDYVGGVFLDIFPVDLFPQEAGYIRRMEEEIKRIQDKMIECVLKNDCDCKSLFELVSLKIKRLCYNHRKTVSCLEGIAMSSKGKGEMMVDFHNYFYVHGGWPASFFGDGVLMEFEGNNYIIPDNWNGYLTHMFGDYMVYPPVEKRHGHCFEYVNYERRLSDIEIREELKRIHTKYAYHFSIKREIKYILRKLHYLS